MYLCVSVYVRVCGFVYVCEKQGWSNREREGMSEGRMKQDIKGAERFGVGREGKWKRKEWWGWRLGGGVSSRLPSAPYSTLQAHTLTSKWYPLSARGSVGPCPPPMSLHTSSRSCWIIDSSVLHAQHLPGHGSVTPNRARLWEVPCFGWTPLYCIILSSIIRGGIVCWNGEVVAAIKMRFFAAVLSKRNRPHRLKSFLSHVWVDGRFHFLCRVYEGSNNSLRYHESVWVASLKILRAVWWALTFWICWTRWMSLKTNRMVAHSKGQRQPWVREGAKSVCARAISEVK